MKKTALLSLCILLAYAAAAQVPCDTIRHTNLPYVIDFEGRTDGTLFTNGCWQRKTVALDTATVSLSFADHYCDSSAGCVLRLAVANCYTPVLVTLPPVDDFTNLELSLKCYAFHDDSTWVDPYSHYGDLWIGVLEDSSDWNSFVSLGLIQPMNAWRSHTVRLGSYHGQGRTLALRAYKFDGNWPYPANDGSYFWYVYIDSLNLHHTTSCGTLQQLTTSNIEGTHATVSWTDPEWAGNYQLRLVGGNLDTTVTTTDTFYTFTGLVPHTHYTVSARALCAAGEGPLAQTSFLSRDPADDQGRTSVSLSPTLVGKTLTHRAFIPDGQACPWLYHIELPMMISEFREDDTIRSGDDVRSVCVNMEHSFSADVDLAVICPTGQQVILKNGNRGFGPEHGMAITGHGGNAVLGLPLDGAPWDDSDNQCDSLANPFGTGLEYCFSRSEGYTLVTGDDAHAVWDGNNLLPEGNFYISSPGTSSTILSVYTDTLVAPYGTIPSYFLNQAGVTPPTDTLIRVKHPSNHAAMSDYYLPVDPFEWLIGCPMNGEWKLFVRDNWGHDNGWVFNWSIDFRNPYACDGSQRDTIIFHDTIIIHDTLTVTVGIDQTESIDVKIYTAEGHIVVDGTGSLPTVQVFDVTGREIAAPSLPTATANGSQRLVFTVPSSGAYMVKVGNAAARKVVVVR